VRVEERKGGTEAYPSPLSSSFEQGRVELDEDLIANSKRTTETLVRVGVRIGKATSGST
jgi:hypothetical protein